MYNLSYLLVLILHFLAFKLSLITIMGAKSSTYLKFDQIKFLSIEEIK